MQRGSRMIKIRNFTKKYEQFLAVDRLDLDIEAGEIFGFKIGRAHV